MLTWLVFVVGMAALAFAMLVLAAFLVWDMLGRRGPRTGSFSKFESTVAIKWPVRLAKIVTGVSTSITAYAIPLMVEAVLLRTALSPWLVIVFWADVPGAVLLYCLGHRKTAVLTYASATLIEAILLSRGMLPDHLMMLTNIAPAIAVGAVIAERSTSSAAAF